MEEPQIEFEEAAAGIIVDYTTGRTDSVLRQRASFLPKDNAPILVEVPMISAVDFDSNEKWNIVDHFISTNRIMTNVLSLSRGSMFQHGLLDSTGLFGSPTLSPKEYVNT